MLVSRLVGFCGSYIRFVAGEKIKTAFFNLIFRCARGESAASENELENTNIINKVAKIARNGETRIKTEGRKIGRK